jgi:hypothetical protein
MKNFKGWLKRSEIIDQIIRVHFDEIEKVDLSTTIVYVGRLTTGQQVNFGVYKDKPNKVQIGFSVDRTTRHSYGDPSPKDPASNQQVMPGSLALMRKLKAIADEFKANGMEVIYNPIDQRRDQLYRKYLS